MPVAATATCCRHLAKVYDSATIDRGNTMNRYTHIPIVNGRLVTAGNPNGTLALTLHKERGDCNF